MGDPRPWSELLDESRFVEDIDGFRYVIAEPSALQLAARGVVPPGMLTGKGGDEADGTRIVVDETVQNGLLESSLIEPRVCAACQHECEHGKLPIGHVAKHRDRLVLAILSRLYDTQVVRGAAFRDGEGPRRDGGPNRTQRRNAARGRGVATG